MNKAYHSILATFLLLFFLATLIPVSIFHKHKEKSHCNTADVTVENNPCHISAFHEKSNNHGCEHRLHLAKTEDKCNFCNVLIPKRDTYTTINDYDSTIIPIFVSQNILADIESFILLNNYSSILGRAPPVS